jgi:hypothetical protein
VVGVLAPLTWPFVVLAVEGSFPDWSTYPGAALSVFAFALAAGTGLCLVLGIPALLCLDRLERNTPWTAATVGASVAVILFHVAGPGPKQAPFQDAWPVYVFLAVLGGGAGFAASRWSRPSGVRNGRGRPQAGPSGR